MIATLGRFIAPLILVIETSSDLSDSGSQSPGAAAGGYVLTRTLDVIRRTYAAFISEVQASPRFRNAVVSTFGQISLFEPFDETDTIDTESDNARWRYADP
jgi:hypothetical protein